MTAWNWVSQSVVFAVHDRLLAEHGGPDGIRDLGMIESALDRARNLAAYRQADAADLAAAYAFGLVRNHGFADGNKRTAWVVARLFLADNGYRLRFVPADAVHIMEAAAAGTIREADLADWFRKRLHTRP
ncbi:type II toxin-antitoxin system death-on-curing family toxin [Microbaculum marinum]|uniref:Type II toxin-antitoxin system death-on-curing family toxin n=1 Tax=Microbaculum marinum TaxID=1764581 RepID=A0AAW9RMX0_9HYPH